MNTKQNLLHWANLLYVALVVASFPIVMAGAGSTPPPTWLDPAVGTVVAQVSLTLIPALIFTWLMRQPFTASFKLQRLDFWSGVKCFLIGLTSFPMFLALSTLTQILVMSISPATGSAPPVASRTASPWIAFLSVAVVAPLCEEALFRGVFLSVYEKRFAARAIWLVSILFALYHVSSQLILGALFVSIIAGWVVYRTRSIWAGVLVHVGPNLISASFVLLITLAVPGGVEEAAQAQADNLASMAWISVLVWGSFGLVMLAPCFFLLRSVGKRYSAPVWPDTRLRLDALWSFIAALVVVTGVVIYYLVR